MVENQGDVDFWIEKLYQGLILSEYHVKQLCHMAREMFLNYPNIINVSSPVTICGDMHGQFGDLIELFRISGRPPNVNFLFLGDYVDRGNCGVEVFSLLIALKMRWPSRISLLRGNHECRQITTVYGFYEEVHRKYLPTAGPSVWEAFQTVFDALPLAAIVDKSILCMHGGLSPMLTSLDALRSIDRVIETPPQGLVCDLLWSDPEERPGWGPSPRGAGCTWGADVTDQFLRANRLALVTRAHQLVMDGFAFTHGACVLTVFSAPNYCYRCSNTAATLEVSDASALQPGRAFEAVARGELRLQQFEQPLVFNSVPPNLPATSNIMRLTGNIVESASALTAYRQASSSAAGESAQAWNNAMLPIGFARLLKHGPYLL